MAEANDDPRSIPQGIRNAGKIFADFVEQSEVVVHTTHEGFARVQMMPDLFRLIYDGEVDGEKAVSNQERIARAEKKAEYAAREADAGFPFVHAHSLMGLWGALECFVEDLFVGMLEAEPAILSGEGFRKVKLPASVLVAGAERERFRVVLAEATRLANADLGLGVSRFERLLALVGLDGPVPRRVRDAIFTIQQIRNVWAHRGGLADPQFLERCPWLGFEVGARVDIGPDRYLPLMHGVHMYGVVITNRYRVHFGLKPGHVECPGYEGVLAGTGSGVDDADDGAAGAAEGGALDLK